MSLDGMHREVVVVGGGQAGLAMTWWLADLIFRDTFDSRFG
jgi:cation diffusion facilitator CzcD-associated flavoprotein CzcO